MEPFYIDFIIAGPGINFFKIKSKEVQPIPDAFYNDLQEALSEYSIFENLDTNFTFNGNRESETILLPAFRYSIKLGVLF